MAGLRGFLWLLAGLVVALLAAYVGFVTISRATAAPASAETAAVPTVQVVVAARAVPVRSLLTAEDVKLQEMPPGVTPENALASVDEAVGKVNLAQLYPGEALLAPRLLEPNTVSADGRFALFITEDELLIAVPAADPLSQSGVLKPGDKVDLQVSLEVPVERIAGQNGENVDDEQQTFVELQNLQVAAVLGPTGPITPRDPEAQPGMADTVNPPEPVEVETLLLTAAPQDALVVKYAIDAGGTLSFALRAPDNDKTYETEPVDVDYLINRYDLPNEVGK